MLASRAEFDLKTVFALHEEEFLAFDGYHSSRNEFLLSWFLLVGRFRYSVHPLPGSFLNQLSEVNPLAVMRFATEFGFEFYSWADLVRRYGLAPFRIGERCAQCDGVSLVGFASGALGIGEDLRSLIRLLKSLSISVSVTDLTPGHVQKVSEFGDLEGSLSRYPVFRTVIFCLPLFEIGRAIALVGSSFFSEHYLIGYIPWELTAFPTNWRHCFSVLDEVWAASGFLLKVFGAECTKIVELVPPFVEIPEVTLVARERFGLSRSAFTVLSMCDLNSTISRKNPDGAIRAFRSAFDRDDDVQLLIKTTHGDSRRLQDLIEEIGDDPRITIVDGVFPRSELMGLVQSVDVFISLHRSEGFGRVLCECMALGTPVISTDWSGPSDFLNDKNSFLIGYKLRAVREGEYPFGVGLWAEPNYDEAASVLRLVRENGVIRRRKVLAARRDFNRRFSLKVSSERLRLVLLEAFRRSGVGLNG